MTDTRTRRCIITFRVSQDEYRLLKEAYDASSSRSLSDYARGAVMERVAHGRSGSITSQDITELQNRIDSLESTIRAMMEQFDHRFRGMAATANNAG